MNGQSQNMNQTILSMEFDKDKFYASAKIGELLIMGDNSQRRIKDKTYKELPSNNYEVTIILEPL